MMNQYFDTGRRGRGSFGEISRQSNMKGYPGRASRQPQSCTRVASALASLALGAAISLLAPGVGAVTLGGYEVQSALGQSLRMSIQINARPDEEIDASCFRVNPFSASGDGLPQLTAAQLRLDRRPNEIRLVVTSARAIMDPIVRVAIDVGCNTTLRREITLLLDPPSSVETLPQVAEVRPTPVPIPSAGTGSTTNAGAGRGGFASGSPAAGSASSTAGASPGAVAGTGSAGRASTPSASPRPPARTPAAPAFATPSSEPLAQVAPRPPRSLQPPSSRTQPDAVPPPLARPAASRDRLTISASPLPLASTGSTLSPRLNLATSLGDRGRPPLPESTMSSLRQKQARLRAAPAGEDLPSLEAEVVVLQKRTTDMQRQLDEVMSQMASLRGAVGGAAAGNNPAAPAGGLGPTVVTGTAPATATTTTTAAAPVIARPGQIEPPDKPWTAILTDESMMIAGPIAVMLVLLILGFVLWLRREREQQRRSDRWSYIPVVEGATTADRAAPKIPEPTPAPMHERASPPPISPAMTPAAGPKADMLPTGEFTPPQPQSYQFKSYASGQAAQDLGVSDLAQATEKASVFVTLGRPAQAIDVLRDHIDHEPKSSAMAWLMLLDLYRQTNRREDFDEVAERFHSEFNAVTPEWSQGMAPLHDTGLGAFPYLIARIRDTWPTAAAKGFIEDLLYDNRGGSRLGFSIPAFRDLLLLHSLVDEYLRGSENEGNLDSTTGRIGGAINVPTPPDHLASIWKTASPERPVYTTPLPVAGAESSAAKSFADAPPASDADLLSSLEKSYPIIAQAIASRWGQAGLAAYLSNLIRSSTDQGAGLTNEALSELIMLHDIALDLGDPEPPIMMLA